MLQHASGASWPEKSVFTTSPAIQQPVQARHTGEAHTVHLASALTLKGPGEVRGPISEACRRGGPAGQRAVAGMVCSGAPATHHHPPPPTATTPCGTPFLA